MKLCQGLYSCIDRELVLSNRDKIALGELNFHAVDGMGALPTTGRGSGRTRRS